MINYPMSLNSGRNVVSKRSAFWPLSIAMVLVAALTVVVIIQAPAQKAYGDELLFIQDEQSCEESPISGGWDGNTDTCTVFFGLTLEDDDDVEVAPGITVVLPNGTQSVVGGGRTLFVASGGILNIEGEVFNAGTISNSGILTVSNPYASSTGIFSNGTITNTDSGVLTVSNGAATNQGIENLGTFVNDGTLIVSNTGPDSFGIVSWGFGSLTNSGTLTLSNTGIDSTGISNFATITNTNSGVLTISNSAVESTGIIELGTTVNAGTLIVSNTAQDSTGIVSAGTINNTGTLTVNNNGGVFGHPSRGIFDNGSIVNSGTLTVSTSGDFSRGIEMVGSSLTNTGNLILENTGFNSIAVRKDGGVIDNTNGATMTVGTSGHLATGIVNIGGTFSNSGLLNVNNTEFGTGIFNLDAFFSSSGILNVYSSGDNGQGISNSGNSVFFNSGSLDLSNSGNYSIGVGNSGNVNFTNAGTVTISNTGLESFGIDNSGIIENQNSGVLNVNDNGIGSYGLRNDAGAITVNRGTIDNSGTITNCGIFSNQGTFTGNPVIEFCDFDLDGIANNIDTNPNSHTDHFQDASIGGNTTGTITSRGDQALRIVEAPNPEGVQIKAHPLAIGDSAEITACDAAIYSLSAGDDIIITCGSVITQVIQGPVEAEFVGSDGSTASATIAEGNTLTFDPDTFSFTADPDNESTIEVIIEENTVIIEPSETVQRMEVTIDIKPGGTPNTINIKKDKIVTVALLGNSTFDVNTVNRTTLNFGSHTLQPAFKTSLEDVNGDSYIDLVMQFKVLPLGFAVSDTEGCLTGLLQDGTPFVGCDSVRIINK